MPYGKGQPEEEAVLKLGTGNHILVKWLNTYFTFQPEGDLVISNEDAHIIFSGGELDLVEALSKAIARKRKVYWEALAKKEEK